MAANNINLDQSKPISRDITRYARMMKEGADGLKRAFDALHESADNSRDQASDFDLSATLLGADAGDYASASATCLALYGELNSVTGNYNTATKAALDQLNAYLGLS